MKMRFFSSLLLTTFLALLAACASPKKKVTKSTKKNSISTVPQAIKLIKPQIIDCYVDNLKNKIDLKGKVVAAFQVDDKGKVAQCNIKESTMEMPAVDQCVCTQISKGKFPPAPKNEKLTVVYPFSFGYKD